MPPEEPDQNMTPEQKPPEISYVPDGHRSLLDMETSIQKNIEDAQAVEKQRLENEANRQADADRLAKAQLEREKKDKVHTILSAPFEESIVFPSDNDWRNIQDLHQQGQIADDVFEQIVLIQGKANEDNLKGDEHAQRNRLLESTLRGNRSAEAKEWTTVAGNLKESIDPKKKASEETEQDKIVAKVVEKVEKFVRFSSGAKALWYSEAKEEFEETFSSPDYNSLPPTDRIQMRTVLEDRVNLLMSEGNIGDIKGKADEINQRISRLLDNLHANRIASIDADMKNLEKQVGEWVPKPLSENPKYRGVREDYYTKVKQDLDVELSNAQTEAEQIVPVDAIMAQVSNGKLGYGERYSSIDRLDADSQETAMNFILDEFEREAAISPLDSRNNAKLGSLNELLVKPNMDKDVVARAKARLHLQTCAVAWRRKVKIDGDRLVDSPINFPQEIGDYGLGREDFKIILKNGIPELKTKEAFIYLEDAAYEGLFAGKSSDEDVKPIVLARITMSYGPARNADDYSKNMKLAEKSYSIAMSLAEATGRRSVWDTTGKYDFLSNAIYLDAYREAKNKGFGPARPKVQCLATDFFASVTDKNNKERKLSNSSRWSAAEIMTNAGEKRVAKLALQRIINKDNAPSLATTYSLNVAVVEAAGASGRIDLNTFDFDAMGDKAYEGFTTSFIKDRVEAKKLFTDENISLSQLGDPDFLAKCGEVLDKVDTKGDLSLRFWYAVDAMGRVLNDTPGPDAQAATLVLRRMVRPTQPDKTKPFLPETMQGINTYEALKIETSAVESGRKNATAELNTGERLFDVIIGRKK